ncbi:MAG: right-handed parallel beta-helix repeat-containing protein, partial [Patescibacteria group bacterium]
MIIQSSGTYNLTADISGAPYSYYYGAYTTCIQINASSVTLDCGGRSITTTGNAAVEIEAPGSNVIVQNCVLNGGMGVAYMGLSGSRIIYNRINPSYAGVSGVLAFSGATGNDIIYNNITGGTYGIWEPGDNSLIGNNRLINQGSLGIIDAGTGNMITNNYVSGSAGDGMLIDGSNQLVSGNTVTGSAGNGVDYYAYNTTFSSNTVSNNGNYGIWAGGEGSGDYTPYLGTIGSNQVYDNGNTGIEVRGAQYLTVSGNNVYNNPTGIHLQDSQGEGFHPARYNVFSSNNVHDNDGYGFDVFGVTSNSFISNTGSSNGASGFVLDSSSSILIDPSTFCSNVGDGLQVTNSVGVNVTDSTFCNNGGRGLLVDNVNNSVIARNTVYGNVGGNGIEGFQSYTISYLNNTVYSNGGSGISLSSTYGLTMTGNYAHHNAADGFDLAYSSGAAISNNTANYNTARGFFLVAASGNTLNNNAAWYNNQSGFELFNDASYNSVSDNSATGNSMNGIFVYSGSYNWLVHNTANQNNQSGIMVLEYKGTVPASNNTLINNSAYFNDYGITLGEGSTNTTSQGDNPYNNRVAEMRIIDTQNATILYGDYSGNAYDVSVEGQSGGSFRMNYAMFGEPGGSIVNMTNLSITDAFGSADNYTINWTQRTDRPTHNWHSFKNRTVNITDRETSSIDYIEFDWTASDAVGYNESNLGLWKYNSSGWTLMNSTPNAGAHHLSLRNLAPNSAYSLYEFIENCPIVNTSGTFTMTKNYTGSPNPVYLPIAGSPQSACVVINASNVIFDCNGLYIRSNSTAGATAGIVTETQGSPRPQLTNITIRNCPEISGYNVGLFMYNTTNSLITNVTAINNSPPASASTGFMLYYSPNVNFTNTVGQNHTYNYYINLNSNNVRITNSTARTGSTWGFYFSSSVANGSITDSVAVNNNGSGILMDGSGYPVVARNNVSNSPPYNADAGIIISASNALVEDNIATGATSTPLVTWGYGFIVESGNVTLRRNLAYGNKVGFETFGWDCNITNNTARDNLEDGFAIYSEDDIYAANDAFQNGANGFAINYTVGADIVGNRAFSNTANGFSMDEGSEENLLSGNLAYQNAHGFFMNDCTLNNLSGNSAYSNTGHGIYLNASTYNRLIGNNVYSNGYGLSMWSSSNYNVVENNTATTNTQAGIYVVTSAYNNLTGNNASSNANGVYALSSLYNTMRANTASGNSGSGFHFGTMAGNSLFVNNTASGNALRGIYLASSGNSNLSGNTAFNNAQVGVYVLDSPNVIISNDHYYGNGDDFRVSGTGTVNLSGVSFDNPAGGFQNYTNLSLNDTLASESYLIRWIDNSTTLPIPVSTTSFRQKFVSIENLTANATIDSIVWNWLDSELANYTESSFGIFEFNDSSIWANTFATLLTGSNTLSLANVSEFSVFAVLQFSSTESDGPTTEPTSDAYDVSIKPACQGFIVSVKDGGTPVPDAFLTGTDETHAVELSPRYTNSSGQAYFPDCDIDVSVKAVKEGREGTDAGTAACGVCPVCATDDDCADSEQCSNQQCVPVNCPSGRVVNHACEQYECMEDSDCPVGQSCIDHRCKTVYECTYGLANTTADDNADCADNEYCDVPVGQPGGSCKP